MNVQIVSVVFLPLIVVCSMGNDTHTEVRIAVLFSGFGSRLDVSQLKPAIDVAFDEVAERVDRGEFLNFTYTRYVRETVRDGPRIGVGLVADLVRDYDIHAVLGHPSSSEMYGIGDLVAHWNIPAITGAAITSELEDRTRYTTFTRTSMRSEAIGGFIVSILETYGWNLCTVFHTSGVFTLISDAIIGVLDGRDVINKPFSINLEPNVTVLLQEAQSISRSK